MPALYTKLPGGSCLIHVGTERQFEFIQNTGVVTAMVGLLQALPRSRLYRRLASEGRLISRSRGDNTRAVFNFEPRLDREFMEENYRRLMRRLYEPRNYYRRICTFITAHELRGPRAVPTWQNVGALFKSFWIMGVIHRGRGAYWRFIVSTLVYHPRHLGLAVTLAITGHHFRLVADKL